MIPGGFGPNELMLILVLLMPVIIIIAALLLVFKLIKSRRGPEREKVVDEIQKLTELRDQGTITEEEFNDQKKKLLER